MELIKPEYPMQGHTAAKSRSNEVDLLELFKVLWLQKWLVVAITFVFVFSFAAYAFMVTPVFEAKYYVSPPRIEDIASLNYGRSNKSDLKKFTVKDVYEVFIRNLQSQSLRQSFFNNVYIPGLSDNANSAVVPTYAEFSKNLIISPLDKKEVAGSWSVTFQGVNPEKITEWANLYVAEAAKRAEHEVLDSMIKGVTVLAGNLQASIDMLRESGERKRLDAITHLEEALSVAKASRLEESVVFAGGGGGKLAGDMEGGLTYLRGTKALEAQLRNLQKRTTNDSFIPGLRKLQAQYTLYKEMESGKYDIAVFHQDGVVDRPVAPIKPRKFFIILLGLILGGVIGCSVALIRGFFLAPLQYRAA